mmetsp:Transcript_65802/g.203988  ORF Transcript_65802/g.203988 Transcript_65802/m.203988 type:complete len:397 (-) Transcript_65802:154-1344(-)
MLAGGNTKCRPWLQPRPRAPGLVPDVATRGWRMGRAVGQGQEADSLWPTSVPAPGGARKPCPCHLGAPEHCFALPRALLRHLHHAQQGRRLRPVEQWPPCRRRRRGAAAAAGAVARSVRLRAGWPFRPHAASRQARLQLPLGAQRGRQRSRKGHVALVLRDAEWPRPSVRDVCALAGGRQLGHSAAGPDRVAVADAWQGALAAGPGGVPCGDGAPQALDHDSRDEAVDCGPCELHLWGEGLAKAGAERAVQRLPQKLPMLLGDPVVNVARAQLRQHRHHAAGLLQPPHGEPDCVNNFGEELPKRRRLVHIALIAGLVQSPLPVLVPDFHWKELHRLGRNLEEVLVEELTHCVSAELLHLLPTLLNCRLHTLRRHRGTGDDGRRWRTMATAPPGQAM